MALTREQKQRLGVTPKELIEAELASVEFYREQIAWYESIAEKSPANADLCVEGIRTYINLLDHSRKIIEREQENARQEATLDAEENQRPTDRGPKPTQSPVTD